MPKLPDLSRQFNAQGFVVLPGVFSPAQCAQMVRLFDNHWIEKGRPSLAGFGFAVHPLLQKIPEMAAYFARPVMVDALGAILGDEPRLVHTGARVSNEESSQLLGWHEHYSWDKAGLATRTRPERVLFGCYVRGSNDALGPLVAHPRRINDPLPPLPVGAQEPWPGEVAVSAPPGSVVIFDTALYHTARRGTQPGFRYLWGAHIQGKNEKRTHPEDNSSEHAGVAARKKADPLLRRFIDGR
jgi:hypothetical protein